jgi:mannose-6-phosphate isomerase-like protein (cupin superfamily)
MENNTETRPWGNYITLARNNDFVIKLITVKPSERLSLQTHAGRSEHWVITQGTGIATVGDKEIEVAYGNQITIEVEQAHRIENNGEEDLCFIEVQTGSYFTEDDIVRLEDDYGRA